MNRAKTAARRGRVILEAVENRLLMSAGQLDPGYASSGVSLYGAASGVPITSAVAVGTDGRQVVINTYGPSASSPASSDVTTVSRYADDGTPDTTFGINGTVTLTGELVNKVLIRPSGQIITVGSKVRQLTTTGAVDTGFAGGGVTLAGNAVSEALQPGGKLLVSVMNGSAGSAKGIYRYNLDGSLDGTFGTNGISNPSVNNMGIAVDGAGNVFVAGGDRIAQLDPSGNLNINFGSNGIITFATGQPTGFTTNSALVAVAPNGSIDMTANFGPGSGNGTTLLMVSASDGSQGAVLHLSAYGVVRGLAVQPDNKIVVAGASSTTNQTPDTKTLVSRYAVVSPSSTSVTADTTFNSTGTLALNYATHVSAASDTTALDDEVDGLALGPNAGVFFVGTAIDPGYPVNSFFYAKAQADPSFSQSRGSITGRAFYDTNGDGIQQSDESSLPLYGAFLDNNNNGVFDAGDIRSITDAAGNYAFFGLTPGTYHVVEIPPVGYLHTNSNGDNYSVTVSAGGTTNGVNFGLQIQTGTITGTIFNDTNGNGVQDATEIGLQGWGVYLDNNNNGIFDAGDVRALSDATGTYSFSNLAPGTYNLRQNVPAGYTLSTPTSLPQTLNFTLNGISRINFGEVSDLNKFTGSIIGTSGSFQSIGNTITNVFDGDLNTFFDAPGASGAYVGLDLGTPRVVKQVVYAPRSTFAFRMVGGVFQGSNSATFSSGVVTLGTISSTPQVGVLTPLTFTSPGSYRYYRYLGPSGSYDNISEMAFYG